IYRNKREEIETRLQEELTISLEDKYIVLESALLREIKLPEQIENAIQDKLKAKEEAAKIDFQIERQKKESERIRIEALAKAEANRILSASLTDKILQEKGILATQELAKSPNTKVVVVGGKDGLPLILNQ
ncbi:MAG: SPFH domain-containing protein, partial [Bacteroidota bacterium]